MREEGGKEGVELKGTLDMRRFCKKKKKQAERC